MIVDRLVDFIVATFSGLLSWVPDAEFPWDLSSISEAWLHIFDLGAFLPIPEVITAVLVAYTLGPGFLLVTLTLWLTIGVLRGGQSKA